MTHAALDMYLVSIYNLFRLPTLVEPALKSRQDVEAGAVQARLVVDLKADFSDEFSWNTKQIFLFLTVEYASRAKPINQLTMWSRILHKVLSRPRDV